MDNTPLKGIKYNSFWGILDRQSNEVLVYNISEEDGKRWVKKYPQFYLAKVRVFAIPEHKDRRKICIDSSLFIT